MPSRWREQNQLLTYPNFHVMTYIIYYYDILITSLHKRMHFQPNIECQNWYCDVRTGTKLLKVTSWCRSKCTLVLWSAQKWIECKLNINNRKSSILKNRYESVIFDHYFYITKILLLSKFDTTKNKVIVSTV